MSSDYAIYLPQADTPSPWKLDVLGAGKARILPGESYPPQSHPSDHTFVWDRGRILDEYQILLIAKGAGILETSQSEPIEFKAPFLFLVFPGVWHRYRPRADTGWHEHWIAFHGGFVDSLQEAGVIDPRTPSLKIGHNEMLLAQIQLIHDEVKTEALGYRRIIATAVMQILALATSLPMRSEEENHPMRAIVRRACFEMRERADSVLYPEELAQELNVGYTYFRRMFKKYTGLSPKRYHSQLRLQRVKRLLRDSPFSISEISDSLGFHSPFHLSSWFKKETGQSPQHWRSDVSAQRHS